MPRLLLILWLCLMPFAADAGERELADLLIRDNGHIKRYVDVVKPPEAKWWMKSPPLPRFSTPVVGLPDEAAWMKAYDFDADAWLSRAEMTQAWLVRLAHWTTGRNYKPGDLMAAPETASLIAAAPQSLTGVEVGEAGERAVRAALDSLAGKGAGGRTAAQAVVNAAMEAVTASLTADGSLDAESEGGDDGAGAAGGGGDGGGDD